MKLEKATNKLRTNVKTESHEFGIADMSIVINLLTNLYSNPKQTLTQEYLCNARDANREAKSTKAIEVICPTNFKPTLTIRDFGPGLSPERVMNVFLYYGKSTKTSSNKETGGFGIGGKSAWAYTDSFVIHSYYNGKKYSYAAIKAENKPTLNLLSEQETDQPNGVAVEIAVSNYDITAFQRAVVRAVKYWKPEEKPVIKNLNIDETNEIEVLKTYGNLNVLNERNYGNGKLLVIDGIPYRYNDRDQDCMSEDNFLRQSNRDWILNIPTGAVTIAPNREELIYDKKTTEYLKNEFSKSHSIFRKEIDKELKACKTIREYIPVRDKINTFYSIEFEFKNYKYTRYDGLHYVSKKIDKETNKPIKTYLNDHVKLVKLSSDDRVIKQDLKRTTHYGPHHVDATYYVDTEESAIHLNRRLRTILENGDKDIIYIVSKNASKKMVKDLELLKVSDYEMAELPKREPRAKLPIDKKSLVFWGRYGGSSRWLLSDLLEKNNGKVVYAPYKRRNSLYDDAWKMGNLYFVSESAERQLSKATGFISYDEYIKTTDLSKPQKTNIYRDYIKKMPYLSKLVNNYTKQNYSFKSKELNNFIKVFKDPATDDAPKALENRFYQTNEYKKMIESMKNLDDKIKTKCEMLKAIPIESIKDKSNVDMLTEYVNNNLK